VKDRIPHEIVASVLAATTAFIGGNALDLPPWAIFIGWAGTFLAGGPSLQVARRLWLAMPAGSAFALLIVLIDKQVGTVLGSSRVASDAVLALIILVVNCALMYTGRTRLFSLVPGMFFGFASYFATFFGGFGFAPQNPWAAWVSVVAMNALGPVFAYLSVKLAFPRSAPAAAGDVSAAAATGPAASAGPGSRPRR
jgi:hypothetical protein